MSRRREKGLVRERRTKDGKIVWYYREGQGKRIRLPDLYGSPEFNAALKAAKGYLSAPVQTSAILSHQDSSSLAWLIDQYMSSAAWAGTAAQTQKQRRNILKHVIGKHGATPFRSLTQRDIEATHEGMVKTGKTAQANAFVKVMRVFCAWATPKHMPVNIARDVELVSRKSDGFYTWTDDDLQRFEAFYGPDTRERVAYAVLLWTGQRRGDAVQFGKHSLLLNGRLKIRSTKTGTPVSIPVMPELAEALRLGPTGERAWIVGDKGLPISADAFTTWFRQVCNKAGLPQCSAHGLRKAAARRFAERGATVDELKAWFGWTENRTPGIYTRDADNSRLADNAAKRMLAA